MFSTFALFLGDDIACRVCLHLGAQLVIKLKGTIVLIPILVL